MKWKCQCENCIPEINLFLTLDAIWTKPQTKFFSSSAFFLILRRFRLKPCSRLTKSKRSNTSHELLTEPSVGSKIRLLFWAPPLQCRRLSFQNIPWGHVSNADSALSHNSSLWPFSVLKIAVFSLSSNSTTKVEFYVAE